MCYWEDKSSDEELFEMRVKVGNTGSFVPVNYYLNNAVFGTWYSSNRFLAGIAEGTLLHFQVVACNANIVRDQTTNQIIDFTVTERSRPSNTLSVPYTQVYADPVLHAPTQLSAQMLRTDPDGEPNDAGTIVSDGLVQLRWKDGFVNGTTQTRSEVEDGFSFYVKESTAATYPSTEAFSLPFDMEEFTVPAYNFATSSSTYGLAPGKTYNIRMRAVKNNQSASEYSNEVTLTVPALKDPISLQATRVNDRTLLLTWDDRSENEHGYLVQLELGSFFGDLTWDSVGANNRSYLVNNLIPGTTGKWKIVGAFNPGAGAEYIYTAASNVVEFKLTLPAPANLQGSTTNDTVTQKTRTSLTWTENAASEDGIAVLQRIKGTTDAFAVARRLPPNTTSTVLENVLLPGQQLEIIVRTFAVNSSNEIAGSSDDSNIVEVTTKDGFTNGSSAAAALGDSFQFNLTTSQRFVRQTWSVTGLPDGLGFDSATGLISGTPLESGVFVCNLSADFADGWVATSKLTLRIAPNAAGPPVAQPLSRTTPISTISVALDSVFSDPDVKQAVRLATNKGNVDLILYPDLTPATVNNFMAYVNAGDYNNTVFHRVAPGFVLQGGGYKLLTAPKTFEEVTKRSSPPNEPGVKNQQWTLAMAKSSEPDSATHNFFINLADNTNLDTTNGGFTVFGRLADRQNVRDVVTTIVNLPGKKYPIDFRPSGQTTIAKDFNPLASLGETEYWPLDVPAPAPEAIDSTKLITISTVTPIPLMTYAIVTPPDTAIATATIVDRTLQITGVTNGSTSVTVQATDLDGHTTNLIIPITVDVAYVQASITSQPVAVTTAFNTGASFTVGADGSSLSYQWRKNGIPLPGPHGSTLALSNVTGLDAASYDVVVSNAAGSVVSASVTLTVITPVSIVTPPANQTRGYNTTATFTVAATGTNPQYQWRKNSNPISAANQATFTTPPLLMTDSATYDVVVSNTLSTVTSEPVTLTVVQADNDNDGIYDDEEVALGLNNTLQDHDGDGSSDGVERMLGTDPKSNKSRPTAFVAQRDAASAIQGITLRRLSGNGSNVADQWMMRHEMTNEQFAAILQRAVHVQGLAEIVEDAGRRYVRAPRGTGPVIGFLKDDQTSPASMQIRADVLGTSFVVDPASRLLPVQGISWYGAWIAAAVLNESQGYVGKTQLSNWSTTSNASGWALPSTETWTWAARGGDAALDYPTGAEISGRVANIGNTSGVRAVGSFPASVLGYFDLAGNVAEWLADGDALNGFLSGASYLDVPDAAINGQQAAYPKLDIAGTNGVRLVIQESGGPVILTQPSNRLLRAGQALSLSVTASGAPPLRYQWSKNGKIIAGATSASYQLPAVTLADAANYRVRISSQGAELQSQECSVSVVSVPAQLPPPAYIVPNRGTSFSVRAATAPGKRLLYRWSRPLAELENDYRQRGVDKPTLRILSAQQGMTDSFVCNVSVEGQSELLPVALTHRLVVYNIPVVSPAAQLPFAAVGLPYSYQIPFDDDDDRKITKWTVTGLPPGLSFDALTGIISGIPSQGSTANVRITASNPYASSTTQSVNLVVRGLPGYTAGDWLASVSGNTLSGGLGGRVDFKVSAQGSLTGRLLLGQISHSFKGRLQPTLTTAGELEADLNATITIPRTGLSSLKLQLAVTPSTNSFVAELSDLGATGMSGLEIKGWRSLCDADVSATSLGRLGLHNVALAPPADRIDPAAVPQGVSAAQVRIANNGVTTATVSLADGTICTSSGLLGPEHVLLYSVLYKGNGSLAGVLRISENLRQSMRIAAGEKVVWLKQNLGSASTERSYAAGFGPLNLVCLSGAKYLPPTGSSLFLGVNETTDTPNADIHFSSGGLTPTFSQAVRVTKAGKAIVAAPNTSSVTLGIVPASGVISGTFTSGGFNGSFFGLVVPDPVDSDKSVIHGHFNLPSTATGPILSGRVDLLTR
jgi:cyclophilin family peptidyl-prolyl cis-trans isomerase